jgi:hypothetical protein
MIFKADGITIQMGAEEMKAEDKKRVEDLRFHRCSCAEDEDFLFAKLDSALDQIRQDSIMVEDLAARLTEAHAALREIEEMRCTCGSCHKAVARKALGMIEKIRT